MVRGPLRFKQAPIGMSTRKQQFNYELSHMMSFMSDNFYIKYKQPCAVKNATKFCASYIYIVYENAHG